jgi:DNA mismatch repair protein MutL
MRAALRSARGAVDAPFATMGTSLPPPLAWEGLGGASEVRERFAGAPHAAPTPRSGSTFAPTPPASESPWAESPWTGRQDRLAEPSYERRPVPLSGQVAADRGLVFLGQYKASLLLLESPDALLLVDQHAAHERILYERLHDALAGTRVPTQRLLVPTQLELGVAERERLASLLDPLADLGFELVLLSGGALAVTAVPTVLTIAEAVTLLGELAAGTTPGDLRERILAAVAAERACRGAVRIHRPLAGGQAQELVSALFRCRDPWACPHGRPTVLRLGDADLERRFGRR